MGRPYKLIVDIHDVSGIMGKSPRAASNYLKKIRANYGKDRNQCVTVEEFCEFSGIPIEIVHAYFDSTNNG